MAEDYWDALYPQVPDLSRKIATAPGSDEERLRLAMNNLGYCLGTAVSAMVMVDPSLKNEPFKAVAEQLLQEIVSRLQPQETIDVIAREH